MNKISFYICFLFFAIATHGNTYYFDATHGNDTNSGLRPNKAFKSLLKIKEMPKHLDASDGLAAAVCHYFQNDKVSQGKSYSNWSSFLKDNPGRLK